MDKIEFNCPRCGTHFTVSPKMAGRKGKCKRCQHRMKIPRRQAEHASVAVSGRFSLNGAAAMAAAPGTESEYVVNTQAGLVAVSERLIHHPRIASEPEEVSGPYRLNRQQVKAVAREKRKRRKRSGRPAGLGKRVYRKQTVGLLSLLRRLNDFAYLLSLPFLLLVMMGILIPSRQLAVIGAAGVILPNIGRFAVNASYLVILPFRDSPLQGVLFFIPPFTFYYLYKHWKRMRRATLRFLSPAIPIACVVLAFVFVPWLRSGETPEGSSLTEQIHSEASQLRGDVEEQINEARTQVEGLSTDERLHGIADDVQQGIEDITSEVQSQLEEMTEDVLDDSEATDN